MSTPTVTERDKNASVDQSAAGHQPERRVHHRVRAVFSEVCALIAPLLADPSGSISGFGMAPMLRNHYPELTDAEIHILITAATNYLEGRA